MKLFRIITVSALFVALFALTYCVLPLLVYIFGGSFTLVAQSIPYALFGSVAILVLLGFVFDASFDEEFYAKN